jgi:hypothetical protein
VIDRPEEGLMELPPPVEELRDSSTSAKHDHPGIELGKCLWYLTCHTLRLARAEADRCMSGREIKRIKEFKEFHDTATDPCVGVQE